MAELKILSPLRGYNHTFSCGTRLYEPDVPLLISVSVPLDGATAFEEKLASALGILIPESGLEVGRWSSNEEGRLRCLGLALDQIMIVCSPAGDTNIASLQAAIGEAGYITDQSDNWALLMIEGSSTRAALERLCMLDLGSCAENFCGRTVMEHLPVVIVREGSDRFLLMTLSSYADSFLHTFKTALESVV